MAAEGHCPAGQIKRPSRIRGDCSVEPSLDVVSCSAARRDAPMAPVADSATLNVQPRQRRVVYEALAKLPDGRSVKDLLGDCEIPETELRETLRKLDDAGLATRTRGTWNAVPLVP